MNRAILAIAALSAAGSAWALPANLNIDLSVRDFSSRSFKPFYNPNFEKPGAISGLELGIVQTTLVGKLPTFNNPPLIAVPGGGPSSVTTAADYNEWWAPGVDGAPNNAAFTVPITATLISTIIVGAPGDPNYGCIGTYSFDSSLMPGGQFFPIDGAGSGGGVPTQGTGGYYGNEGRPHNYGFTVQYNTDLVYQPGVGFAFFGDDDLWVFVDNKLVLDLGGVHPQLPGGFILGAGSTDVDGNPLGLVPGNTYDIDIYYAERHTTESNLKFEFTRFDSKVPEAKTMVPSLAFAAGLAFMAYRRRQASKA
jgi:fibro-slime domain-containing protein